MRPADLAWPMFMLVMLLALAALWGYGSQRINAAVPVTELLLQWTAALGLAAFSTLARLWRAIGPDGYVDSRAFGRISLSIVLGVPLGLAAFVLTLLIGIVVTGWSALWSASTILIAAWSGTCIFVAATLPAIDPLRRSGRA